VPEVGVKREVTPHQLTAAAKQNPPRQGPRAALILLAVPLGRFQPLILDSLDDLVMTVEYLCV